MYRTKLLPPLALAAVLAEACGYADAPSTDPEPIRPARFEAPERLRPAVGGDGSYVDAPYANLSDYGVVRIDAGRMSFATGVVAYDVNNPLFTDYATKARAVFVPPGTRARYDETRPFDFPAGSIVIKSFGYEARWIETRLLIRTREGWRGYAYTWDDAQRDAVLRPGGAVIPTTTGATHLVPNQNQCPKCHADGEATVPIGLRKDELSRRVQFDGLDEDQLARWTRLGILEGAPPIAQSAPSPVSYLDPSSGTVTERARAYLEANCAHCHKPTGSARTTGLFLGRRVAEPYAFGVCKSPVAAGRATGGLRYDVVPGAPDESILVRRLRSTEPSVMMPEIGRSLVHEEGVALVASWIAGLGGSCAP